MIFGSTWNGLVDQIELFDIQTVFKKMIYAKLNC